MKTAQPLITGGQAVTRLRAGDSTRFYAVIAFVVTPLAFVATLLLALGAGATNAALIAIVPALFAAGFFGGLYWLAVAVERDESKSLAGNAARMGRARSSRAA